MNAASLSVFSILALVVAFGSGCSGTTRDAEVQAPVAHRPAPPPTDGEMSFEPVENVRTESFMPASDRSFKPNKVDRSGEHLSSARLR